MHLATTTSANSPSASPTTKPPAPSSRKSNRNFTLNPTNQFWSNAAPLRHRDFSTLMTQRGPKAPAQSVGRVARLSRNVRQSNHVLANSIAGHQAERRPRAGEEWRATTKHDGAEVESILIDKTGLGQALRQDWSGNLNLASQLGLQPAYHLLEVIRDKRRVGAN